MTTAALTPARPVRRGGPTFLTHTLLLTGRQLRAAWRMPAFLVMNLVQPVIWLLLFGQLFKSVIDIPGFGVGQSYLEYLTPGVVMMLALFGSAWSGTVYIQDMDRGVMDRFLTSPTNRAAMIVSTLVYQSILAVGQSLIVLGIVVIVIEVNIARLIVTLTPLQIAMFLIAQMVGVSIGLVLVAFMFPLPPEAVEAAAAAASAAAGV